MSVQKLDPRELRVIDRSLQSRLCCTHENNRRINYTGSRVRLRIVSTMEKLYSFAYGRDCDDVRGTLQLGIFRIRHPRASFSITGMRRDQ